MGRVCWTPQHQCIILDRHFRAHGTVEAQLGKHRLWNYNPLRIADLTNVPSA